VDGECDVDAWGEALGVPVRRGRVSERAAPIVLDLLQYGFSASLARWQTWRTTITLAMVLALVALGGLNLHAWTLRAKEKALQEAMTGIVKESFPRVPVVLDPLAQMRRLTADLRTGAGTEQGGFLALLAALGEVSEADSVQSVDYREGRFTVRFRPQRAETEAQRATLVERADRAGMVLQFSGENAQLAPKRSL
jgi:type II secretion system protein L